MNTHYLPDVCGMANIDVRRWWVGLRQNEEKIVGGNAADKHEYPWLVSGYFLFFGVLDS